MIWEKRQEECAIYHLISLGIRRFLKNIFIYLLILKSYLFLAVFGLCYYAWAFSSCSERGLLFVAVLRLLIVVASLVAEHGL